VGEAGRRVARLGSLADRPEDLSSPQRHTFRVPPNPKAGFDGIVVRCQVLECEPPSRLASSWSAGPIKDGKVTMEEFLAAAEAVLKEIDKDKTPASSQPFRPAW
jgi:uncharacterized protein YndB with AHSA1/START domain